MFHTRAFAVVLALLPAVATAQSPVSPATPTATPPALKVVPLEPQGFDYDPAGRRDPFVSLLRRGTDTVRATPATRGPGLGGLETSEVALRGTVQTGNSYLAILAGVDKRTYIVRVGDRLLDGTIRSITANAMVILQQVSDSPSLNKQQEVRKTIRQADEAK